MVSAVLTPLPAFACSLCANTQLHQEWWVLGAVSPLVFVLCLEAVLARPRLEAGWPRMLARGLLLLGVGAAVAGGMVAPVLSGVALAVALWVRALVVAGATLRSAPRLVPLRMGLLLVAMGVNVAWQAPPQRNTEELVRLLSATPYRLEPGTWALEEVRRRAEALTVTEQRLANLEADASPRRVLVLLDLQRELGGALSGRASHCARIREAAQRDEGLAPVVGRVCGGS
jgi:hypothetical protein